MGLGDTIDVFEGGNLPGRVRDDWLVEFEGRETISGFLSFWGILLFVEACIFNWCSLSSFRVRNPWVQYSKGHECGQSSVCSYMCSSRLVDDRNTSRHMPHLLSWSPWLQLGGRG